MDKISLSAAIITYYRTNASRRSSKPWVFWRSMIVEVYGQERQPAELNRLINEGVRFSKTIHSAEDVSKHLKEQTEELAEVLVLLDTFFLIVKGHNEFLAEKLHRTNWEKLLDQLKFRGKARANMEERAMDLVERFEDHNFHLSISTRASIWLLVSDYIIRWGILALLRKDQLVSANDSTFGFSNIDGFFLVIQIFLIPFIVVLIGVIRNRYIEGKLKKLTKEIGLWNIRFQVKYNSWEYSLIVFFMSTGIYIAYTMLPGSELERILLAGLSGLFYLIYLMVILRIFSARIPNIDRINAELLKNQQSGIAKELDADENDEEIVNLEVKLRSVNERMNAYVLEATLFGALAFSGFLQIVASEVFTIADIRQFTVGLFQLFDGIVHFDMRHLPEFMAMLHSREGLLALICYETLFCSIFFLSVIASRLRFSDITDYMDRALQLSRAYNLKEEDLLNNQEKGMDDPRVQKFNRQIRETLKVGSQKARKITPIMEYMAFFRNMGVISFFIILITAGLFISIELALIFVLILLLSFLYFKFDSIIFFFRSLSYRLEEFYFGVYAYVNRVAWGIIIVSTVLRSLEIQLGELLLFLGFLILITHNLLSLFAPEIESVASRSENETGFSKSIPKLYRIGLSIFFLGWYFSIQHFPGAEAVFTVSGIAFCLYFFFTPLLKEGTSAMGMLTKLVLGMAPIPLIFTVNDLVFGDLLFMIEVPLLLVILYNAYSNREVFRPHIVRASVLFLILYSIQFFSFSSYAFESLRFDLKGYRTYVVKNFLNDQIERFTTPRTQKDFTALLQAKRRYSDEIVDQNDWMQLNAEAKSLMNLGKQDERFLILAVDLLERSQAIKKFSGNYQNRLEVLIDLGRITLAKSLAEEYLEFALLHETRLKQDMARAYLNRVNGLLGKG